MFFPTSYVYVKWICHTCSGEYPERIREVVNGTDESSCCKGTRAIPGKTSLMARYPDIAKLLSPNDMHDVDYILPDVKTPFIWRCPECNYDYNAPAFEIINGYTCPYCNDRIVKPGYNSFADRHPDLLEEMDQIANYLLSKTPYDVFDTSGQKYWWICKRNPKHKYPMSPRNRLLFQKRDREPCLYCRGQRRNLNHFVLYNKKP